MPTASVRSLELFIVSTSGIRNSFHAQMAWIIVTLPITGLTSGTIREAKVRTKPAPSMQAASYSSLGMAAKLVENSIMNITLKVPACAMITPQRVLASPRVLMI